MNSGSRVWRIKPSTLEAPRSPAERSGASSAGLPRRPARDGDRQQHEADDDGWNQAKAVRWHEEQPPGAALGEQDRRSSENCDVRTESSQSSRKNATTKPRKHEKSVGVLRAFVVAFSRTLYGLGGLRVERDLFRISQSSPRRPCTRGRSSSDLRSYRD